MKNLLPIALATVLGFATYGAASLATSTAEAEACGYREPAPTANVSGTYDSNYGLVTLKQNGRQVLGSYDCCGGGTINGYMSGNTIRFSWSQPGSSGRGVWTFDKGKLVGTWGYQTAADGGSWSLQQRPVVVSVWRD